MRHVIRAEQGSGLSVPGPAMLVRYTSLAAVTVLAALLFGYAPLTLPLSQPGGAEAGSLSPALRAAFAFVTLLLGIRWCVLFAMGLAAYIRTERRRNHSPAELPLVSIYVPAYNEAETIEPALRSLIAIEYPRFEVIVVDDGSKDQTYQKAKPFEGAYDHCTVRVYRKPNGGKWSALNFAFHHSVGELALCVDADSRLDPQALRRLVAHMADPDVASVAGQVRVRNRHNLLTRLQGLEYVIANGLIRMAQSLAGSVLVVPGPIGLFRRTALEEVYVRFGGERAICKPGEVDGPFEGDTFAEDFDLSLTLLALGGKCVYEPLAVSHTKAPESAFRLVNQRYRWCRGTIQVLRKYLARARAHSDVRRPPLLLWLGLTYLLELVIMPFVNATAAVLMVLLIAGGGSLLPMAGWMGAFMGLNFAAAAFFISIHRERFSTLAALPFYDLYHAFLLNGGLAIAAVDELRGRSMRW